MKIPFFHDRDYHGYFGILDKTGRDVIYVSDRAVANSESISRAMETYGTRMWINHMTPYQKMRISTILT